MIEFQVKDKRFSRCGNRQLPCGARPVLEYAIRETVEFTFDFDLDAQALHTLSGDSMPLQSGEPMLFATGIGTGARKLQFEIDTMNQSFLEKCRSFHQKLYLEIAEKKNGSDRILLQDWIECSPRVNVSGTPPEPVTSYYTAAEVDARLAQISGGGEPPDLSEYAKKSELPQKLSQLENDSAFLSDAPADDALYGRQNGQWTALVATEENYSAAEKAKLAELPSAAELDQRFADLATGEVDLSGYYTRAETDALLAQKPDRDELPEVPDTYSRSEIDAMFGAFEQAAAAVIGEPQ